MDLFDTLPKKVFKTIKTTKRPSLLLNLVFNLNELSIRFDFLKPYD